MDPINRLSPRGNKSISAGKDKFMVENGNEDTQDVHDSGETYATYPVPRPDTGKNMALACHLLGLLKYTSIPFANIIGPLILWLVKKDEFAGVDHAGKEAVNFQITIFILVIICIPLVLVLIGWPLLLIVLIYDLVMCVNAAIKTNNGEAYRYPFSFRFIK
jgi:uncharacterized Tic20 family protein